MIDSVRTDVLRLVDTHVKWSRPYVSRILQLKRIPPSKLQMSVCVCVCVCVNSIIFFQAESVSSSPYLVQN